MTLELTSEHTERFERDGYTIVRGGFDPTECDHFVDYMSDLQAGRQTVEGFAPRAADDWSRLISRNCHHPAGLAWMLDPRLRQPLPLPASFPTSVFRSKTRGCRACARLLPSA